MSVRRNRGRRKQVHIGASDASLTGCSGLVAVSELVDALDVAGLLDRHVGPVKRRDRGLSGGEFLVSLATAQLLGEDCLAGFDRLRGDAAGQRLAPVPSPAQTTAGSLARRFGLAQVVGIETAVGELAARWLSVLPVTRRVVLRECPTEERLCRRDVTSAGQPDVNDLAVLVDRAIQVRPPAGDLDIRLVDEPPITRAMAGAVGLPQ